MSLLEDPTRTHLKRSSDSFSAALTNRSVYPTKKSNFESIKIYHLPNFVASARRSETADSCSRLAKFPPRFSQVVFPVSQSPVESVRKTHPRFGNKENCGGGVNPEIIIIFNDTKT